MLDIKAFPKNDEQPSLRPVVKSLAKAWEKALLDDAHMETCPAESIIFFAVKLLGFDTEDCVNILPVLELLNCASNEVLGLLTAHIHELHHELHD